jgi:hypothetical protein
MRHVLTLTAVIIGFGLGFWVQGAAAAPLSGVSTAVVPAGAIQAVGYWRRYCKFNDCTGADDVDVNVDVTVPGETPPVIAIVPVRPVSCGQYRYWDGERCVDARYNNPYLGPR